MKTFIFAVLISLATQLSFGQAMSLKQALKKSFKDRVAAAEQFQKNHVPKEPAGDLGKLTQQFLSLKAPSEQIRKAQQEPLMLEEPTRRVSGKKSNSRQSDSREKLLDLDEGEFTSPSQKKDELDLEDYD